MKKILATMMVLGASALATAHAAAPADAPAAANGVCKDGTYSESVTKKGACHGHKGIKEWWGKEDEKTSAKTEKGEKDKGEKATKAEKPATEAAAPKAAPAAAAPAADKPAAKPAAAPVAAAPGGGPGQVWVNTKSKVYHCQGDKWYGKTKEGEYMSESDATAKGFRAEHGKSCKS